MTKKYRFIYLLVFIQYSAICGCIILYYACVCVKMNEWLELKHMLSTQKGKYHMFSLTHANENE